MSDQAPQWQQVPPYQRVDDIRKPNVVVSPTGHRARVPKLPFDYWLKPSGSLVRLAVGSTRNFKGATEAGGDPMRPINFNRSRALRQGFLPWEYAQAQRLTPWLVGSMTSDEWDVWRHEEQARRKSAYDARSKENARQFDENKNQEADAIVRAMVRVFGDAVKPAPAPETDATPGKNPFARKGKPAAE